LPPGRVADVFGDPVGPKAPVAAIVQALAGRALQLAGFIRCAAQSSRPLAS